MSYMKENVGFQKCEAMRRISNGVTGDLLEQILEGVQRGVAFSVIAPVAGLVVGPIWRSLLPPAAI
jgi:hypothetical protein